MPVVDPSSALGWDVDMMSLLLLSHTGCLHWQDHEFISDIFASVHSFVSFVPSPSEIAGHEAFCQEMEEISSRAL